MAKMGLLGKLAKGAAPKEAGKKKDDKPQIDLPDAQPLIEGFTRAHADCKDAEGRKEQFKALISNAIEQRHKDACRDGSGYHGAVMLNGKLLCYVQYNKFHNVVLKGAGEEVTAKIEEFLKEAEKQFAKDAVAQFFTTEYAISFRKEGLDDAVLAKIMEAVGGDEAFNKLFEINASLIATKALHEARFIDPKVDEAAKKLEGLGLKRYSPALKPE